MSWIATAAECRELDQQAEVLGISVETLMHEAGRAVAARVLEHFPAAKRIVVLAGKGNNGGDGLVAARLLAEHQREVEVLIAASRGELSPNAQRVLGRLREPGIKPVTAPDRDWESRLQALSEADLIVDALLGTGATGVPRDSIEQAILAITASGKPVLSVDIPSGIDADTGHASGTYVRAVCTVTFGLPKPFAFQSDGLEAAGTLEVAPIGFPEQLLTAARSAFCLDPNSAKSLLPCPSIGAHKGTQGHVLIVAGHDRMPGAAVLAARGALRAGAGLVSVAAVPRVCDAVSHHLSEAILVPLPGDGGILTLAAAPALVPSLGIADAVVFGPALSTWPETAQLLEIAFAEVKAPCVLDADALNHIAAGLKPPAGACVLTPHPGEAGRLLQKTTQAIQEQRFANARLLSEKYGKTLLLKGAFSLIAHPGEPLCVNPTGNPGMAAPGMGDVLSGVIGALLAQGLPTREAAMLGAYWHGFAGDLCAKAIGPSGFFASELADLLPQARATIAST